MTTRSADALPDLLVRRWPEHRAVVVAAAMALLIAVFTAQRLIDDASAGIGLLAVLPIILLGLELGITGGLLGAAAALAALLFNSAAGHPELGTLAFATRATMFLTVGAVSGTFSGRVRAAFAREQRLLRSALAIGEAPLDRPLAGVIAEAARGLPGVTGVVVTLAGSPAARAGHHGPTPVATPIVGRGIELGRIETAHVRTPSREDLNELRLLADQAAAACDSRLLVGLEREQAAVRLELEHVRDELLGSRAGAGEMFRAQEDERHRIADELQEDLAQALAAVLIGLRLLEGGDEHNRAEAASSVRAQVVAVLEQVRSLAGTLRPSALQQLGLEPALETLASASEAERSARVRIGGADGLPPLPEALAQDAYRLVEDIVRRASAGHAVDVFLRADDRALLVTASGAWEPTALAIASARAGARGGTLEVTHAGHNVQCILPLHASADQLVAP